MGMIVKHNMLAVKGFNHKYIYISLLFPKLKKSVKEIDILKSRTIIQPLPIPINRLYECHFSIILSPFNRI